MPIVNGKHYAYTADGMAQARKARMRSPVKTLPPRDGSKPKMRPLPPRSPRMKRQKRYFASEGGSLKA